MLGIPNVSGLSNATSALAGSALGIAINLIFNKKWGLYNKYGVPILLSNHVVGIQYTNSSSIADAPLEKGSFASYNKTANPYSAIVQLVKGDGGVTERSAWLAQLEYYANSTMTFYVVSPEFVYMNACVENLSYSRSGQEGLQLIRANLSLREVREVTVSYSEEKVKNADDTATKDSGNVQPQANNSLLISATQKIASIF